MKTKTRLKLFDINAQLHTNTHRHTHTHKKEKREGEESRPWAGFANYLVPSLSHITNFISTIHPPVIKFAAWFDAFCADANRWPSSTLQFAVWTKFGDVICGGDYFWRRLCDVALRASRKRSRETFSLSLSLSLARTRTHTRFPDLLLCSLIHYSEKDYTAIVTTSRKTKKVTFAT